MADLGLNICIIARNEEKIKKKLDLIMKSTKNKNLQTMYIIADFSKLNRMSQYQTEIISKLKCIDIAFLVLNAGIAWTGPFEN